MTVKGTGSLVCLVQLVPQFLRIWWQGGGAVFEGMVAREAVFGREGGNGDAGSLSGMG